MRTILLLTVVTFIINAAAIAQPPKIACTDDEMVKAVNMVAAEFAEGVENGDDPVTLFNTAQVSLQLARSKCVPTPIFREIGKGKGVITIGHIPDGTYKIETLTLFPVTFKLDPEYDNVGCGIEQEVEYSPSKKEPLVFTTENCDLHLLYETSYDAYLVITPQ